MAVLSDAERFALWARWMQDDPEAASINKVDIRAAINAADDWAESNAASYNSALPQPARSALSARQKARILSYVIDRRFNLS